MTPAYIGRRSPRIPSSCLGWTALALRGSFHDDRVILRQYQTRNAFFHALIPPVMRTILARSAPISTNYLEVQHVEDAWVLLEGTCTAGGRALRNVATTRNMAAIDVALHASILVSGLQESSAH